MCYRAFEKRPLAQSIEETGSTHVPLLRPRWLGVGAAVVAATAFAAVMVQPKGEDARVEQRAGAAQQIAMPAAQSVGIEKVSTTTLPADDDVPTSKTASSFAAGGDCHHGL